MEANREQYVDEKGYYRYEDNNNLVHRELAFRYLYSLKEHKFPFRELIVHHKDHDKKNNDLDNLEIQTEQEHKKHHNFKKVRQKKKQALPKCITEQKIKDKLEQLWGLVSREGAIEILLNEHKGCLNCDKTPNVDFLYDELVIPKHSKEQREALEDRRSELLEHRTELKELIRMQREQLKTKTQFDTALFFINKELERTGSEFDAELVALVNWIEHN